MQFKSPIFLIFLKNFQIDFPHTRIKIRMALGSIDQGESPGQMTPNLENAF